MPGSCPAPFFGGGRGGRRDSCREVAEDKAGEFFALKERGFLRLFLGVVTGFDGEAEGAGVAAVEGHGDGGAEGVFPAEVFEHADPGDALEQYPVQSDAGG